MVTLSFVRLSTSEQVSIGIVVSAELWMSPLAATFGTTVVLRRSLGRLLTEGSGEGPLVAFGLTLCLALSPPRPPSMPTNDNLDLNQSAKDLNFDIDSDSSAHPPHHPPHWMKWIPLIQPWHMFAPKPFDLDLNLYIHLYQDQDQADHAAWEEEEVSSMNHLVEIYPRPRHPRDFSALISLLSMTVEQRHVFLRAAAQRVHTQLNCLSSRLVGSSNGRNSVVRRCPDVQEEFFVEYEVLLVVHQNVFIHSDFLRKRKIKGKTKRMCEAVVLKRDVLDSNDGSMY